MFAMGEKLRALPSWREIDVFAKLRPHCLTEIEQDEEHCLDAMLHWRDPVERSRILRSRRHALVDDNPICGTARGARSFSIDFTRVDGAFICTALKHGT